MMSIIFINTIPIHPRKNFLKKGGDLNDKGGLDRSRGEGGQNLESGS